MNRPKKSEYMKIGDTTTPYIFYKDRYMDALDIYCDHLEKALDKACEILYLKDYDNSKDDTEYMKSYKVWKKDKWKAWLLKDE